jgi:hypothetical protein
MILADDGLELAERFGSKIFKISRVEARLRRFFSPIFLFSKARGSVGGCAPPPLALKKKKSATQYLLSSKFSHNVAS